MQTEGVRRSAKISDEHVLVETGRSCVPPKSDALTWYMLPSRVSEVTCDAVLLSVPFLDHCPPAFCPSGGTAWAHTHGTSFPYRYCLAGGQPDGELAAVVSVCRLLLHVESEHGKQVLRVSQGHKGARVSPGART